MKLKKIIILLSMILLMSSLAFAQGVQNQNQNQGTEIREGFTRIETPVGFETSLVHVRNTSANQTALDAITRNLNQFRERHQERICGDCSIDLEQEQNRTRITQRQERRIGYEYLNFPVQLEEEIVINEAGEVLEQRRNFWKFFLNFRE